MYIRKSHAPVFETFAFVPPTYFRASNHPKGCVLLAQGNDVIDEFMIVSSRRGKVEMLTVQITSYMSLDMLLSSISVSP